MRKTVSGDRSLVMVMMLMVWCLLANQPGMAQKPEEEGRGLALRGQVVDSTGASVAEVRLTLMGPTDRETYSDETGKFTFKELRVGNYMLVAERLGLKLNRQSVKLEGNQRTSEVTVTMQPSPVSEVININSDDGASENLLKLPVAIRETPRAITVIGAGRIREQNLRNLNEVLAFVPNMQSFGFRAAGDNFMARGYRMAQDDIRQDGFAGVVVSGGFAPSLFGVEQVVALNGPAGLLYGQSIAPGGLINLVSKKPREAPATQIDVRTGGFMGNGVRLADRPSINVDFDSTGPLDKNGRLAYRALATLENQNYFTANVLDRNRYVSGAMQIRLDRQGLYTLMPIVQFSRFNRPVGGGIVFSPTTSLSTNDGLVGIDVNNISPLNINTSLGSRIDERLLAGFDFRATPTRAWQYTLSYRRNNNNNEADQFTAEVNTQAQVNRLATRNEVERWFTRSLGDRLFDQADTNLVVEARGEKWKSMTQGGAYARLARNRTATSRGQTPFHSPVNIFTGVASGPLVRTEVPVLLGNFVNTTTWNSYLQNRTSLFQDKLVFTLGLGYGQNHPGGRAVQKGNLLPNYAVVWNAMSGLSLYGSYAESFNPVDPNLEDFEGRFNSFAPTTGTNREVGAKYDLPNRKMSLTLALFDARINNALVQSGPGDLNLNGIRYFAEAGTRRSRGVESTANMRLARGWTLVGTAAYLDSVYTGEGPASARATLPIPGSQAERAPRWSWSTRTRYEWNRGILAGFSLGFGWIWQDARWGNNRTRNAPDPLLLPAYHRLDAAIGYRMNAHIDFAVNVDNLNDARIFISGNTGARLEIGAPRSATLRMGYRF
jgi:iron complex outermembrane receptor protein